MRRLVEVSSVNPQLQGQKPGQGHQVDFQKSLSEFTEHACDAQWPGILALWVPVTPLAVSFCLPGSVHNSPPAPPEAGGKRALRWPERKDSNVTGSHELHHQKQDGQSSWAVGANPGLPK